MTYLEDKFKLYCLSDDQNKPKDELLLILVSSVVKSILLFLFNETSEFLHREIQKGLCSVSGTMCSKQLFSFSKSRSLVKKPITSLTRPVEESYSTVTVNTLQAHVQKCLFAPVQFI